MWRLCNLLAALALASHASALSLGVSRRQCVAAAAACTIPFGVRADDESPPAVEAVAPALPPPPPARTSITYPELTALLIECKDGDECAIQSVAFTSANGETGDAIFVSGERVPILGIPEDNPSNDSSPLKLAAKLRDAGVPYTFPFANLLRKKK